jgi:hypothetical protein
MEHAWLWGGGCLHARKVSNSNNNKKIQTTGAVHLFAFVSIYTPTTPPPIHWSTTPAVSSSSSATAAASPSPLGASHLDMYGPSSS